MRPRLAIVPGLLVAFLTLGIGSAAAQGKVKWPTRQRYLQAAQNLHVYLRDPKLAGAKLALDKHGKPKAWSGSFSTVFQAITRSGRIIAVRMFHPMEAATERHDTAALERRYLKLETYLAGLRKSGKLPSSMTEIIPFAFVPNALKIDEQRLPIMKLPWIEGRDLNDWVDRRLGQGRKDAVYLLAQNWRNVMSDLRTLKIAHGDLHHGNVKLDSDGSMMFVDYDSMYVPPLAGLENSEIGHQNYQHPSYHFPKPSPRPFSERMDNFSAIVIYLSLLGVADNPALWKKYHNENTLVFDGERDFVNPDTSPLFKDLMASKNAGVRNLAKKLAQYAKGSPEKVPSLEEAIHSAKEASKPWYQQQQGKK